MISGVDVRLQEVTKRYGDVDGDVHAVDGVSLDVDAGSSLAITGPSGCGKSTLLGLICGLDTPTSGHAFIGGAAISTLSDRERAAMRRREIGLVFQSDNLLPYMTAAENVSLQLSLVGREEGRARSLELLHELELADEADRLPDQLSGGQRQRVAVARALIHGPRLVIADEPTGSLDDESAEIVVNLLLAAQRDTGTTVVLVTHELEVARRLDRTVHMLDGRLVGSPGVDERRDEPPIPGTSDA